VIDASLLDANDESDPKMKQDAARKTTLVSAAVNCLLSAGQVVIGVLAGSAGLVADGIHSLSDLLADFVVLIANHHSHKEADEDHHYGHHRYETGASLFLGLSLLVVGLGMVWSAAGKVISPSALQVQVTALYAAVAALVVKETLFRYMLATAKRVRSSMLIANAWHARSDAASSLVVAVGIVGALAGYPVLDTIGALVVGLLVIKAGWGFSWDALHDLMDRAVSADEHQQIQELIASTAGVRGFHDLRTRKMGDMIIVDVHIEVDGNATVREGHDIAFNAAERVKAALPVLDVMTHLDPV
jgi:cation diffusion facilitator family transporter